MLILICWSVDLQETFVIGNFYQAQNRTSNHSNITEAYVNPNEKEKRFC